MERKLIATLRQQQLLSQEQQLSLRLLQMQAAELQAEIDLMIDDNPMLDRDEPLLPSANSNPQPEQKKEELTSEQISEVVSDVEKPLESIYDNWNFGQSEASPFEHIAADTDWRAELIADLHCLPISERESVFTTCLIEELNDNGFLDTPLDEIAKQYSRILNQESIFDASFEDWENALKHLKAMDPPGVGASGPVEAMILQCERLMENGEISPGTCSLVRDILVEDLLDLARKNHAALLRIANGDQTALDQALELLPKLMPYPVETSSNNTHYILPDIVVKKTENGFQAILPNVPQQTIRLRSQKTYNSLLETVGKTVSQNYLNEARSFINGVKARQLTLQRIADEIIRVQHDFFVNGHAALRPWTQNKLAEQLELSDSTISRAVTGKFILCDHGTFELRSLFSATSFKTHTEKGQDSEQSSAQIQEIIQQLIATEDAKKPLTDDALSKHLAEKGIKIARRTVAKYREAIGIPSARVRKKI